MSPRQELVDTRRPVRREPLSVEEQGTGFHAVLAGATARVLITNDVGRQVLDLCDGTRTEAAIVAELVAVYRDERGERITGDVRDFLATATDKGAIEWTS